VINRESATPIYVQVADVIAARITDGTYLPDRPIPSESHIQQEFGIARDTVRAAVGVLRERGLVVTVRGKGTYVVPTGANTP
jgi:DNA-binding GntR family transcriptional regulator